MSHEAMMLTWHAAKLHLMLVTQWQTVLTTSSKDKRQKMHAVPEKQCLLMPGSAARKQRRSFRRLLQCVKLCILPDGDVLLSKGAIAATWDEYMKVAIT